MCFQVQESYIACQHLARKQYFRKCDTYPNCGHTALGIPYDQGGLEPLTEIVPSMGMEMFCPPCRKTLIETDTSTGSGSVGGNPTTMQRVQHMQLERQSENSRSTAPTQGNGNGKEVEGLSGSANGNPHGMHRQSGNSGVDWSKYDKVTKGF